MNTRQLIEALQKEDPSGGLPVVIDNCEVYFAERCEAYYDGRAQLHIVDESKKPFWSIVGMRVTSRGEKVRLNRVGVEDFIEMFPDGPVELDLSTMPSQIPEWEARIAEWREEIKRIKAEVAALNPSLSVPAVAQDAESRQG